MAEEAAIGLQNTAVTPATCKHAFVAAEICTGDLIAVHEGGSLEFDDYHRLMGGKICNWSPDKH